MTNFEKWKKDGVPKPCVGICNKCEFEGRSPCIAKFVDWLLAEYQEPAPKLTKRERKFLECFTHPAFKEIYRKSYGLYVGTGEPEGALSISDDMFPSIKPGEVWTFEDLLKLEVEE